MWARYGCVVKIIERDFGGSNEGYQRRILFRNGKKYPRMIQKSFDFIQSS